MKLNISYPATGSQKVVEIDDENKLRAFYDKRISHEVSGDHLGADFAGYVFKISGGNDKQGFCMHQGVLTNKRVRILFRDGMKGFYISHFKRGCRKRKSRKFSLRRTWWLCRRSVEKSLAWLWRRICRVD